MKRLILSAVALSMLALPTVQAQAAPKHSQQGMERQFGDWNKKPERRVDVHKKVVKKTVVKRWSRGNRVPAWQRNQVVRDYHRHGLRRPGHGQHWVRVGNEYLLISVTSGIIAALIAAH